MTRFTLNSAEPQLKAAILPQCLVGPLGCGLAALTVTLMQKRSDTRWWQQRSTLHPTRLDDELMLSSYRSDMVAPCAVGRQLQLLRLRQFAKANCVVQLVIVCVVTVRRTTVSSSTARRELQDIRCTSACQMRSRATVPAYPQRFQTV